MRLQDRAQVCGRLGVTSDKAATELNDLLAKWFNKHFVKGLTLPLLKGMRGTEALTAFELGLGDGSEADVIAIVRKLDPHRTELLTHSRAALMAHVRALAEQQITPALDPKKVKVPKPTPLSKQKAAKKQEKKGGVLERARQ